MIFPFLLITYEPHLSLFRFRPLHCRTMGGVSTLSFGLIFLPHAVHLSFSKNCRTPQFFSLHLITSQEPQDSHLSCTKVLWPHMGQAI
jgi:hypothetical protein